MNNNNNNKNNNNNNNNDNNSNNDINNNNNNNRSLLACEASVSREFSALKSQFPHFECAQNEARVKKLTLTEHK